MSPTPAAVQVSGNRASGTTIVIHVPLRAKAAFASYADALWIDAASLLRLLLLREKHLRRLADLRQTDQTPSRPRQPKGQAEKRPTIAARLPSTDDVKQFDMYAEECGLIRDTAAAWLIERELEDRWLESALRTVAAG